MSNSTKILILGGGFGGIYVLKSLQNKFKNYLDVHISLVSKDNYFLYTPMLPQVTSGLIHACVYRKQGFFFPLFHYVCLLFFKNKTG